MYVAPLALVILFDVLALPLYGVLCGEMRQNWSPPASNWAGAGPALVFVAAIMMCIVRAYVMFIGKHSDEHMILLSLLAYNWTMMLQMIVAAAGNWTGAFVGDSAVGTTLLVLHLCMLPLNVYVFQHTAAQSRRDAHFNRVDLNKDPIVETYKLDDEAWTQSFDTDDYSTDEEIEVFVRRNPVLKTERL